LGILLKAAQILFVILPGAIGGMRIQDQRVPLLPRQGLLPEPTIDFLVPTGAPVEERTGVPGIAEDARDPVVFQVTPSDLHGTSRLANQSWKP
jgi:hypothetical protein